MATIINYLIDRELSLKKRKKAETKDETEGHTREGDGASI